MSVQLVSVFWLCKPNCTLAPNNPRFTSPFQRLVAPSPQLWKFWARPALQQPQPGAKASSCSAAQRSADADLPPTPGTLGLSSLFAHLTASAPAVWGFPHGGVLGVGTGEERRDSPQVLAVVSNGKKGWAPREEGLELGGSRA